jgi:hypothetical protein
MRQDPPDLLSLLFDPVICLLAMTEAIEHDSHFAYSLLKRLAQRHTERLVSFICAVATCISKNVFEDRLNQSRKRSYSKGLSVFFPRFHAKCSAKTNNDVTRPSLVPSWRNNEPRDHWDWRQQSIAFESLKVSRSTYAGRADCGGLRQWFIVASHITRYG